MKAKLLLLMLAVCVFAVALSACKATEDAVPTLAIAVPLAYADANTMYLQGIELAKEDIAARGIGLNVVVDDDKGEFSEAVVLAQKYIADPNVIGVVGHWYSDICVSVADLYKNGGKVLIVPTVSVPTLLSKNSNYVFRNVPSDSRISKVMADKAIADGATKALIYYEDSTYGFRMSTELESYIENKGFNIIDKVCAPSIKKLPELLATWEAVGYDTVFVIANVTEGYEFIEYLDTHGFNGRFICSDGLDTSDVSDRLSGTPDLTVCSIFDDEVNPPAGIKEFGTRFADKYGEKPDWFAIIGYDCVMIAAEAVNSGISTTDELNDYFQSATDLSSIFGITHFDETHEIVGKEIYLKSYANGKLNFVK
jgi:branched-chain amino acid transport system substrate-binding protein